MRKAVVFTLAVMLAVFTTSCKQNISIPKSLSVSTGARYKFTVTEISKDLSDTLSVEKIVEQMQSNNSDDRFQFYNYNPNGDSAKGQALLEMKIQEIPVDFSSYLEKANFSSSLEGMSINNNVEIPTLDLDHTEQIDMTNVYKAINKLVVFSGSTGDEVDVNFLTVGGSFESITYATGYLGVKSMAGTLTGTVSLCYGSTVQKTATVSSGLALIPLDDVTIHKTGMKLRFSMGAGATFGGAVEDGSKALDVSGLTVTEPVSLPSVDTPFELSNNSSFKQCVIKSDSTLTAKVNTPGWTMNDGAFDYAIQLSGGFQGDPITFTKANDTCDIGEKTFKNEDINAKTTFTLQFENSSLSFATMPTVQFQSDIKGLDSATIALQPEYQASVNQSQALPKEATDAINSIVWSPSGIKVEYTNSLPAGNTMNLTVKSDFFGIDSTQAFTSGTDNEISFLCADDKSTALGEGALIDFDAGLTLPGYDEAENTITIHNVELGHAYALDIKITPEFKWKTVVISSSLTRQNNKVDTGLKLGSLLEPIDAIAEGLSGSVELSNIDLYLFCDVPDALSGAKFSGKIKAFNGKSEEGEVTPVEGTEPSYLLGSAADDEDMRILAAPELVQKDSTVVTDIKKYAVEKGLAYKDLAGIVNKSAKSEGSLCVDYDIGLSMGRTGEVTIEYASFYDENGNVKDTSTSLSLMALVVVPLELKFSDDCSIDMMKLINKDGDADSDLFKRTEKTDLGEIEDLLDVVDFVKLSLVAPEFPFDSGDGLEISLDWDGDGTTFAPQTLKLQDGGSITVSNLNELLNKYPLVPTAAINLKKGNTLALTSDSKIKAKLALEIKTNEDKEISIFGGAE